jgi:hypothetical protein
MRKMNPLAALIPLLPEKVRLYLQAGLVTLAGLASVAVLFYGDSPVVAAVVSGLGALGLLPTGGSDPEDSAA